VATYLLATFHSSFPIAVYLALASLISILATLGLKDNSKRDITVEYDAQPAGQLTASRPA